jgi:hypothetical protein
MQDEFGNFRNGSLPEPATPGDSIVGGAVTAAAQVFKGNFGGGDPGFTPTVDAAMAYDLDSPFQTWKWNGSSWE